MTNLSPVILEATIDPSHDPLITIDAKDVIIEWNPQAEAIFGLTRNEALGRSLAETIIPERYRIAYHLGLRRSLDPGEGPVLSRRIELMALRRSGQEFPVELSIVPMQTSTGVIFYTFLHDISGRVTAEQNAWAATEELSRRERLLSLITDSLMVLIAYVDLDQVFRFVNQAHEIWFSRPLAMIAGKTMREVLGDEAYAVVRPYIERVLAGETVTFDQEFLRKEGDRRRVTTTYAPHRDDSHVVGFVVLVQDIDERVQAEQRTRLLAEASTILGSSLDHELTLRQLTQLCVPKLADWCALDLLDDQGVLRRLVVEHVDPAKVALAHQVFSRYPPRPEDIQAKVVTTGEAKMANDISEETLRTFAHDQEHLNILRDVGLHAFILLPLRWREQTMGTLTLAISNSGRRFSEKDFTLAKQISERTAMAIDNARLYRAERLMHERLADQAADLARSNQELEQFASVAAHDLQEPLRMITSYIGLLREQLKQVDGKVAGYLTQVHDSALRMSALTKALLFYAQINAKPLERDSVDVLQPLSEALSNLEVTIKERKAAITHDAMPVIQADRLQLTQLFQNLIDNGMKFCIGRAPVVHISAKREDKGWHFTVADNGIGIAPDKIAQIFRMFGRLHAQNQFGGSGIGLATCARIVERHGGRIWVQSEVDKGSRFQFFIPDATA